jgi:hypothetical protein
MDSTPGTIEDDQIGSIAGNAIGDHPTHDDRLGFTPYVEAIASFLLSPETRPPITISIEGEWGSGKSSFLLQLENAIRPAQPRRTILDRLPRWLGGDPVSSPAPSSTENTERQHPPLIVRFNAWRHDKQDSLWAAFALAFVQSLRAQIGFRRAYLGDLRLFLKRLQGARGWAELALLVASVFFLFTALVGFFFYVRHLRPGELSALLDRLSDSSQKSAGALGSAPALRALALQGAWGAFAAVGFAGIHKFHSWFKMPLSLNLEKYISKPDYQGHVAFIESFHLDLSRLIEVYAGKSHVFIFIDDLDRCDVPRAAELMQAINLMIGDSTNLIFVLGMDREKVAAGVALKYKDLFPFLRESAQWKPGVDKNDFTPLYFGYSYLEKFIQLSFSLPIPNDEETIKKFLREQPVPAPPTYWRQRLWDYWRARLSPKPPQPSESVPENAATPPSPAPAPQPRPASPPRTVYRRIAVKDDSEPTRGIVLMVSGLFENNPRRIKQFTNTFRLALYIASDQGIFDRSAIEKANETTPEQVGKFVALLLRFPDLRFVLEENPRFLASLEEEALSRDRTDHPDDPAFNHWLEKKGAVKLLTFNVGPSQPQAMCDKYSLARLDTARLFSVLPRATRPPATPPDSVPSPSTTSSQATVTGSQTAASTASPAGTTFTSVTPSPAPAPQNVDMSELFNLASRYKKVRENQFPSDKRTQEMTQIFHDGVKAAESLDPNSFAQAINELGQSREPGRRLMRLALAYARIELSNTPWLLQMLDDFRSPFEHYWCIQTLLRYVDAISPSEKEEIVEILNHHWNEIVDDKGRVVQAEELRSRAQVSPETASPSASPASHPSPDSQASGSITEATSATGTAPSPSPGIPAPAPEFSDASPDTEPAFEAYAHADQHSQPE